MEGRRGVWNKHDPQVSAGRFARLAAVKHNEALLAYRRLVLACGRFRRPHQVADHSLMRFSSKIARKP